VLGKITEDGVFIEQLETNPSKYMPEVQEKDLTTEVVQVSE
jgi:fumarate hydratase class I